VEHVDARIQMPEHEFHAFAKQRMVVDEKEPHGFGLTRSSPRGFGLTVILSAVEGRGNQPSLIQKYEQRSSRHHSG
jgi:hypothetical protein